MRSVLCLLAALGWGGHSAYPAEETPAPAAEADPRGPSMVIVQPGYPGSTEDAVDFMRTLTGYVGKKVALAGLSGAYYNDSAKALPVIAQKKPPFGIVSLGFYLKHRKDLGLKALCLSKPEDNFVLLGRPGSLKDLRELGGQTVAGGPLHEPEFLNRVILRGRADVGTWKAAPTTYSSKALRQLQRREDDGSYKYRAVILTGREFRALSELPSTKGLEKIFESEYYPPALLVLFGTGGMGTGGRGGAAQASGWQPLKKEEVEKLVRTFKGFSGDAEGKRILEDMGAEGFEEVPAGWIETMEGRYDAVEEKK